MLNQKPSHGDPCNGCGACCMAMRCPIGEILFGPGDRCPALTPRLPELVCGVIADPARYAPDVVAKHGAEAASASASILLGAGTGCDAQLEGERYSLRFGAVMRAYSEAMADQIKDAKAIWGIWE